MEYRYRAPSAAVLWTRRWSPAARSGFGGWSSLTAPFVTTVPARLVCFKVMSTSPIDELLAQLRASLHARRAAAEQRASAVEEALRAYLTAVERDAVREFSHTHGFGAPSAGQSAEAAACALLARVQALPELSARSQQAAPNEPTARAAQRAAQADSAAASASVKVSPAAPSAARAAPGSGANPYPRLQALSLLHPLVILGRLGSRARLEALSRELELEPEWIDTSQHSVASVGNLERRIRDGRVGALVLMEGNLNHKHTEPLVSAARLKSLPLSYAGKGGSDKLRKAFAQLELALAQAEAER